MKSNLLGLRNVILLLLMLVIIGVVVFTFLVNPKLQKTNLDMPNPNPDHKLSYAGSIGIGTDKVVQGVASFKENYQKLDELSLYWYNLDTNGTIFRDISVSEETEKDLVAFAKQNKKKVLFGISDHGEAQKADDILVDGDVQRDHISKIISLLDEKGYDGVIIDYENLREDQEKDFTKYMNRLSQEVHFKGKALGISVPVETQGKVFHGINIVDISKVVDRMHMNVYEQYGQDTGPGPIASIDWVNAVVKNVVGQSVDPSKIILGTAHSGHDWVVNGGSEFYKDTTTKEVFSLLTKYNSTLKWDEGKQSSFFEYKGNEGKQHTVWLEEARSFKAKIDLAKSYELQGMFIWYLGGEDPQVWQVL